MTTKYADEAKTTHGVSVELRDLTKIYGNFHAVNGISIMIRNGEFVTLLGPSGSGKTTTLMMIAGFVTPTSGEILLNGEQINNIPPYRRNLGMVFQNYALFPHMNVFDNIAFPLRMRKLPYTLIKTKVIEVLKQVKMADFGKRYPRQLSGGQQQRIALARSIVFNPPLILMDEPLGALDKKLREHMQLELKHLQQELGLTVLYVTHDQSEALTMSDVVVIMNQGKIEQFDSPDIIYNSPKTRFIADFIGETNIFKVKVEEKIAGKYRVANSDLDTIISTQANISIGQEIFLAIRPERIIMQTNHAGQSHYIRGTIDDIVYLGEINKYAITTGSGINIIVKKLNNGDRIIIKKGDEVFISWSPEDYVVITS